MCHIPAFNSHGRAAPPKLRNAFPKILLSNMAKNGASEIRKEVTVNFAPNRHIRIVLGISVLAVQHPLNLPLVLEQQGARAVLEGISIHPLHTGMEKSELWSDSGPELLL